MKYSQYVRTISISLVALCACLGAAPLAQATSGSTTVSQTLLGGSMTLTSSATAVLGSVTLSGSGLQTGTGSLGLLTVSDARGTNAGWSLTATTTPFAKVSAPVQTSGSAVALVSTGQYRAATPGTYTVTIVNGGALGTATYAVSGLETQAAAATGASVILGTQGLSLTFPSATYTTGMQWTIGVDVIPASNLTITPSTTNIVVGSSAGVSTGTPYTFSTGSDAATIMTASSGNGSGTYTNNPGLSLQIPATAKAGLYGATITETLN